MPHCIDTIDVNGKPMEVFVFTPRARGRIRASCCASTSRLATPASKTTR